MSKIKIKKLICSYRGTGGRNNKGRITCRQKGGQLYKQGVELDFRRNFIGIVAKVVYIRGDWSNRTSYIALVAYSNGYLSYILATDGMCVGDYIMQSKYGEWYTGVKQNGSIFKCCDLQVGDLVHSLKGVFGKVKYIRAAGVYATILKINLEDKHVLLKMASGELRKVGEDCTVVKGKVGHTAHYLRKLYKAGQNRWKGKRPSVRGEAMNPVDHPHGGRTRGGRHPVTPWGFLTKGVKTRKRAIERRYIIESKKK
jgi:large subunit ribosomal protein L2